MSLHSKQQTLPADKKMWGWLTTPHLQTRYILAAHYVADCRHIVELGGYRDNTIDRFLQDFHGIDSVTVFSLDNEFRTESARYYHDDEVTVRHSTAIHKYQAPFSQVLGLQGKIGVVALGYDPEGDMSEFYDLCRRAHTVVMEYPVMHKSSGAAVGAWVDACPNLRLDLNITIDAGHGETLRDATWVGQPHWSRRFVVFREVIGLDIPC